MFGLVSVESVSWLQWESGIHCPLCRGNVTRRERACPECVLDLEKYQGGNFLVAADAVQNR